MPFGSIFFLLYVNKADLAHTPTYDRRDYNIHTIRANSRNAMQRRGGDDVLAL